MSPITRALAVSAALALAALPALAQDNNAPVPPPMDGAPMSGGSPHARAGHGPMGHGHMGHEGCHPAFGGMMMMRYPDGTLAFLHAELHINQNEQSNWDAFAAAVQDSAKQAREQMKAHMKARMEGPKSRPDLPEMLQMHERMAEWHLSTMKRIDAALIPLYNSLDPAQKEKAEHLMMPCHPGPMGQHGGHWK